MDPFYPRVLPIKGPRRPLRGVYDNRPRKTWRGDPPATCSTGARGRVLDLPCGFGRVAGAAARPWGSTSTGRRTPRRNQAVAVLPRARNPGPAYLQGDPLARTQLGRGRSYAMLNHLHSSFRATWPTRKGRRRGLPGAAGAHRSWGPAVLVDPGETHRHGAGGGRRSTRTEPGSCHGPDGVFVRRTGPLESSTFHTDPETNVCRSTVQDGRGW